MAIPPPSPHRMNRHAIEVLDAAREAAKDKPIKPTPAVRLALSWLTLNKIAEGFQVERYWEALTKTPPHGMADYVRDRDMQIYIDRWTKVAADS